MNFFILEARIFYFLNGDSHSWEVDVMSKVAEADHLGAFRYLYFCQSIDILRGRNYFESLWCNVCASDKVWCSTWG
jgi:glucose-1-phosphate cytidylyltransferase